MKTLYCIPSPISEDSFQQVSLESVELFKKISTFFVESVGPSQKLIKHFGVNPEEKEWIQLERGVDKKNLSFLQESLLQEGHTEFGLLCDAGTPGICDPGENLLKVCKENQVEIRYVSGPCSIIASLLTAGMCPANFYFCGFIPQKTELREKALEDLRTIQSTLVLMESPYRLIPILESFSSVWGSETILTVCLNVTGSEQKIVTESAKDLIDIFTENKVKMPFIILVENKNPIVPRRFEKKSANNFSRPNRQEFKESLQQEDFAQSQFRQNFDNRPPRNFGDRPPRRDFGSGPPRNFGDRSPRRDFGSGPPRNFGDRPPRRDFGSGPPRNFGDRPPRRDFGSGPPRNFGDRPPRRDFGSGPPRNFGDRPPRRDFGSGPPRNFGDRPPRRDFGEHRGTNTGPQYGFNNGAQKGESSWREQSTGGMRKRNGVPNSLFKPNRSLSN